MCCGYLSLSLQQPTYPSYGASNLFEITKKCLILKQKNKNEIQNTKHIFKIKPVYAKLHIHVDFVLHGFDAGQLLDDNDPQVDGTSQLTDATTAHVRKVPL